MDHSNETSVSQTPPRPPDRRDALTILRILLLTSGVAVGISVFLPDKELKGGTAWRVLASAVVIGLSLPAPLFVIAAARRIRGPLGPASLFAMGMGTGALLLLPPPLIAAWLGRESPAPMCLYYLMPQAALWFLLVHSSRGKLIAACSTGRRRRGPSDTVTCWRCCGRRWGPIIS